MKAETNETSVVAPPRVKDLSQDTGPEEVWDEKLRTELFGDLDDESLFGGRDGNQKGKL